MMKLSSFSKSNLVVNFAQLALCLYSFCSILEYSPLDIGDLPVFGPLLKESYAIIVLALLIVAIIIKYDELTLCNALFMLMILVIMFIVRLRNDAITLAFVVLFMVAVSGTDPSPYIRASMWMSLMTLLLLVVCTYTNLINEVWAVPNGLFVSGHGVKHPNTFACILFNIEAATTILCKDKNRKVVLGLVALFTAFFVIRVLSSRTGCIVHILLGVACLVEVFAPRITRVFENPRFFVVSLSGFVLGTLAVLCILMVIYTPENPILEKIGKLSARRIPFAHEFLQEGGGLSPFGQKVMAGALPETARLTATSTRLLDCTYGRLLIVYGVAGVLAFTTLFIRACRALSVRNDKFMIWVVITLFAIYGIMENSVAHLAYNCTFALLATGLSSVPFFARAGLRQSKNQSMGFRNAKN